MVANCGGVDDGADAIVGAPEPFGCQASACTPSVASKACDFMFANTRAGSRNSLISAHSCCSGLAKVGLHGDAAALIDPLSSIRISKESVFRVVLKLENHVDFS